MIEEKIEGNYNTILKGKGQNLIFAFAVGIMKLAEIYKVLPSRILDLIKITVELIEEGNDKDEAN